MNTRLYFENDYDHIKPWWVGRWGDAPAKALLPKSGVVAFDGKSNIVAAFVYLDMTSPVALISWVVGNPERSARDILKALKLAIGALKEIAISQARTFIVANFPSGSLARVFESCGFVSKEKDMENLTWEAT